MEEIKAAAPEKIGFAVNIDYANRLCDFKPAYGIIFLEIVADNDFGAHGDVDVVYGNIRDFMMEEILDNHDVNSSRHDFIAGTFCLYRNNGQIYTLFMQRRDYKLVFSSPVHYCFDESNFLFVELQNGATIFDYPDNIQSMTYVVQKAAAKNRL